MLIVLVSPQDNSTACTHDHLNTSAYYDVLTTTCVTIVATDSTPVTFGQNVYPKSGLVARKLQRKAFVTKQQSKQFPLEPAKCKFTGKFNQIKAKHRSMYNLFGK